MKIQRILQVGFVILLTGIVFFRVAQAAVDLVEFTATPLTNSILIEWATATEIDNAGFFVTRNTGPHPPFVAVSGFIPAEGSGVIGANYQYEDTDVQVGVVYYYQLEIIDTSNNTDYSDIIYAVIGGPPTNTPTASSTPTITNTPDRSRTPTRTLTPSSTPTRTYTPRNSSTSIPPTITTTPTLFTETPTSTPSPSITPSPTLFNPPEIVVTFPATNTPLSVIVITATPEPTQTPTPDSPGLFERAVDSGALLIMGLICLIILVWAVLVVGIFLYLQHRNS